MSDTVLDPNAAPVEAAHGHDVFLYAEPQQLAPAVASHLAAGIASGERCLVVCTPPHWKLIARELAQLGHDSHALAADGALRVLDAEETLASILVDGRPSQRRFDEIVGGAVTEVGRGDPVRVYGEMVDLLARRREVDAARELEDLWNRLAARRHFSLLCAYCVDVFDRETQVGVLPMVCATHARTTPAGDAARLEEAVESALEGVLGPSAAETVYALVGEQARERRVPPAQLALMWVSAHMPRSARHTLDAARARYDSA